MRWIAELDDADFPDLDHEKRPDGVYVIPKLTQRNFQLLIDKVNELIKDHNHFLTGGHDVDEFYKD